MSNFDSSKHPRQGAGAHNRAWFAVKERTAGTIALDLDNTVFDYNAAISGWTERVLGRTSPDTCPQYNLITSGWFKSFDEFMQVHTQAVDGGMFADMPVFDGAPEAIRLLREDGWRIEVATYRKMPGLDEKVVEETTLAGLAHAGIEVDAVRFSEVKHDVPADIYIDDKPDVLEGLDERGLSRIAFDREYNRSVGGTRVTHWSQVPDLLRRRAGAR